MPQLKPRELKSKAPRVATISRLFIKIGFKPAHNGFGTLELQFSAAFMLVLSQNTALTLESFVNEVLIRIGRIHFVHVRIQFSDLH